MATLANRDEEERRRQREAFLGGRGVTATSAPVGGGGRGMAAPGAPQQQQEPTSSGVYTDIGKYTRNQSPAAYGMARTLGEGIRNRTREDISEATESAIQNFTGSISPSTFDPEILQQFIANPAGADPNVRQQIVDWRTGGYTGPQSLEDAGLVDAINDVIGRTEQDVGKLTNETGLAELLRRYGDYGPGGGRLSIDLALLRRDPTARTYLGDLRQELEGFTAEQRESAQEEAQRAVEEATSGYTEAQRTTQTQLEQALADRRSDVAQDYEDMLSRNQQQYQQMRSAAGQGGDIDDAQLADLGINRNQWTSLQNTMNQIIGGVTPTYSPGQRELEDMRRLIGGGSTGGIGDLAAIDRAGNPRNWYTYVQEYPSGYNAYTPQEWDWNTIGNYINYINAVNTETQNTQPYWYRQYGGNVNTPNYPGAFNQTYTGQPITGSASLEQFVTPGTSPEISRTISRSDAAALRALNDVLGTNPQYNLDLAGAYTPDIANFDLPGAQSYLGNISQNLEFQRQQRANELAQDYRNYINDLTAWNQHYIDTRRRYNDAQRRSRSGF